jgi:hypothetical protein
MNIEELEIKCTAQEVEIAELRRALQEFTLFKQNRAESLARIEKYIKAFDVITNNEVSIQSLEEFSAWLEKYIWLKDNYTNKAIFSKLEYIDNKIVSGTKKLADVYDDRFLLVIKNLLENYEALSKHFTKSKEFINNLLLLKQEKEELYNLYNRETRE